MNEASEIRQLARQIESLLAGNNPRAALKVCEQINRAFPAYARGWYLTSQTAMHLKNPSMSQLAIERAVQLEPDNPGWRLQSGLCLSALSNNIALGRLLDDLVGSQLKTAYQNSTLGALLCQVGRHEEALPYYEQAVAQKPEDHHHLYNLACLHRSLGHLDKAEDYFDKTIALSSIDADSYKLRSDLRKQSAERNHVDELKELLKANDLDPRDQVQIHFALAKELEDLAQWEDSFNELKAGADIRRSLMKYDANNDLATLEAIQRSFSADLFDGSIPGSDTREPIFILGMPRTGTTLVERILSSHSEVISAGELTNFSIEMMKLARASGKAESREALVEATTRLDFKTLGDAYVTSTRPVTGQSSRFIDKLPLNYLYVGLIHLAMPNAKIVVLKRHPIDTCYSVYKQLFMDAYPFSYTLDELGRYYVAYDALMSHWQRVMPGKIHTVRYEHLTADLEGETRNLLEYCELPFETACLDFTANRQASTTASAAQVRQPVYSSSVGQWKNFRQQLQPLSDALAVAGIDLAEY